MASVVVDTIRDHKISETEDGLSVTRTFLISGFSFVTNRSNNLFAALSNPQIPRIGDSHPTIPAVVVRERSARPAADDNDVAFIDVMYRTDTPETEGLALPSYGSSLKTTKTAKFKNPKTGKDAAIIVKFAEKDAQGQLGAFDEVGVEVQTQLPFMVRTYERREPKAPTEKAIRFTGTVNSTRVWDDDPRLWLCTRIDAKPAKDGIEYDVRYEFQRNRDTWDIFVAYIDRKTGQPPAAIDPSEVQKDDPNDVAPEGIVGNGVARYRVFPEEDFNELQLQK